MKTSPTLKRPPGNEAGCVVLSAGRSVRMGAHKALLPLPSGGVYMSHIIDSYLAAGVRALALVVAPTIPTGPYGGIPGVRIVRNPDPGLGRAHSLRLGLAAMPSVRYCFIQNIDNPFVDPELIGALYAAREKAPYVTPVHHGQGGHPVLIGRPLIELVFADDGADTPLNLLFSGSPRHRMPTEDPRVLANINTPEEHHRHCMPSLYDVH